MPHSPGFRGRRDRRSPEAVSIGEVVDGLLAEGAFSRGIPVARLAAAWPQVVGERLAAETSPASLEHGVLTVAATDGIWGAQAKFFTREIHRKAAELIGADAVRSVRVVVQNRR